MSPIESQRVMLGKMVDMQQMTNLERIAPAQSDLQSTHLSDDFKIVVRSINEQQNVAGKMMEAVDTGRSDDVVGAMVASQKASLSFSMLMEVRNKVLNGIDDVMRMSL
ncbi:flagellar hook-basal body complex protein FliE [Pseudoalteromonas shioyasakiensis]|uniref:flagellar hook-basal body complex protein FliE n=1 Tax=Pseudoalteromonas shioyasakiensis TaxID=1190813 RepID=UPI00211966AF|nr:flagellar hook-basal body complex protein FliE [Pseudoalteromonas shioyasakiensis]MCQ8877487.1 flagellar hook-basal body complex protein FliE [Pseudoalteromonas shioyasakiensis]